ncbi:TPA: conjugal transfer protein TraG N-terminal domain-containing protein [Campylobacter jejuni]|nr:conjugal transfer protein TraG N-terminal domain-containing protein [Campylobacter jejuni]ATD41620.1 Cju26 [Campylobacter jejuni]MCC3025256.1 conjugal transfer protein TraG N-terminal domain-containing protein [Campylobacter jejuni]MCC3073183.1 conjugal transfer protein TraG N-terminal domain-containing protein [Campylobacter jejuni]MCC3074867.1 conjugal transfer protein TraG N-terminal domain-containing protein [Campylobacter jejuni]MCC3140378.1 conjugal transfer protein TraG N-terminal do
MINEMLQAVKGITTEANFLFKAALGIGFLIFSVKKAIDNQTSPVMEFGKLLLLGGVTWNLFLSSSNDDKHRFMVYDEVTSKSYVISQLPVGMGVSFALMSNFERVVLKSMEKHFSTPQSTNFSNAGLGFSLQVMSTLPSVKLSAIDATLQKNIDFYFRNCVSVGILLNQQGRNLFQNSDNLIQDLFTNIGNGSQLTPLFENNNNIEKQSVVPCSDAGPQIVEMIKNDTDEAMKIHAALLGMANDMANYEQKFLGAAQIYNEQAVSARSYLQQSMIMLASQDAIINTAKSVGLNPASVAANTAYADQQFYASMQAQGHMAQTYLPLAKAYLTAIIIGLSWLVALLSIVFGSYAHIKMFFTLCIWIVLWTPILCIINFINDFNLMNVAQVITGGKAALSLGDNMLIFKEVASRSNFMNYLVMSTPVLAYAIAKASEQGFVTFASGLSQALTGASRAAGSFANQQALSTQTSIAAPRGDEVWAMNAGVASLQGATSIGSSRYSTTSIAGGGTTVADVNTGSKISGDMQGVTAANIAGLSASDMKSKQASLAGEVSQGISDALKTGQTSQSVANMAFDHSASHGINAQAQEIFKASSTMAFDKMAQAGDQRAQEISTSLHAGGTVVIAGGKVQLTEADGTSRTFQFSEKEMQQWAKDFGDNVASTYARDDSARASLNNAFSTFTGKEFSQVHSAINKYSSVESFASNVNSDSVPKALNNYIRSGDNAAITNAWNSGNIGKAMAMASDDFQRWSVNNPQQLSKYFNAGDFSSPQNTMGSVGMQNYYSPSTASAIHKGNYGTVDSAAVGFGNSYEADKKSMAEGHFNTTGQNTAWGQGNSQGTVQQEVQGQVNNAVNQFSKPTEQRMAGHFVDATAGEGSLLNRAGSGMPSTPPPQNNSTTSTPPNSAPPAPKIPPEFLK